MRLPTLADFQATGWHLNDAGTKTLVDSMLAQQQEIFAQNGITRDIHVVHMMAQFTHECGGGSDLTESLNYKASALRAQWPTHFTQAQANAYGRTAEHPANQKMIGILAYGGRMGNAPHPSEDGFNYRGRGLIQTTGKNGYRALAELTGLDLVASPQLVTDPAHALTCGVKEFLHYPNMLGHCEADNLLAVSALINRGHLVDSPSKVIGYEDRAARLRQWKQRYGM